ncbi:hypothetical protein RF55_25554, partial [Lasius niger]
KMMRSAASRTLQRLTVGAEPCPEAGVIQQPCAQASDAEAYPQPPQRPRTFIRKVDKYGTEYHVLAKRRALLQLHRDPNMEFDFFELPDLVMDLDAEGTKNVRPFDQEDERRYKAECAVSPERTAVKARLRQFEEQIRESRVKCRQILSQPTNIWRITAHDILSAALRGAPPESREIQGHQTTEGAGLPRTQRVLDKIRIENGIPPHATEEDCQLLHWMMLRR